MRVAVIRVSVFVLYALLTLDMNSSGKGVGASLRRKEDGRFLPGRGQFVGDIRRPGMLEVAFVRSPVAHARIAGSEQACGRWRTACGS